MLRTGLLCSLVCVTLLAACSGSEDVDPDDASSSGSSGTSAAGGASGSAGAAKGGASGSAGKGAAGQGTSGSGQAGSSGQSSAGSAGSGQAGQGNAGNGQAGKAGQAGSGQAGQGGSGQAGQGNAGSGQAGKGGQAGQGNAGSGQAGKGGQAGSGQGGGGVGTCATPCADGSVCADGTCKTSLSGDAKLDGLLLGATAKMNAEVLLAQQPDMSWVPSSIYKWQDFLQALYVMHVHGVGDMTYWLGDPGDPPAVHYKYALANIAAFLGQSMKETIQYDACDENNWDSTNGYKMSNACGQLGQKYEDYDCDMACPKDPTMQMTASTHAKWYGAPGPLFCAPKSALIAAGVSKDGTTGHWDYGSDCYPYPATQPGFLESSADAFLRPKCEVYAGQKAGGYVFDGSGDAVEGCCWWGRGVIQTTGRCNFGKLNHYLGKSHLGGKFPGPATVLYPDISFCEDPEVICKSKKHPELKWIAGLFYWMSSVQNYTKNGWSYLPKLKAYVDGGMTDASFVDGVSGIVNRGCHDPPCGTGPVDGLAERRANVEKVLKAFGLP